MRERDAQVVADFGRQWERFDQTPLTKAELLEIFQAYFAVFPWDRLAPGAVGFDLGCGSGRWARVVAGRVGTLHCIEPSEALEVAKRNLVDHPNCVFHRAGVENIPLPEASADFGYCLGVLHHVSDTEGGIRACVAKLKPGAPFLLYLYYSFENRPAWFRLLWRASNALRRGLSAAPQPVKVACCELLAALVYWPLARTARVLERLGHAVEHLPLSAYRRRSFYVMRTDALDRFGTKVEKRFARAEILAMMQRAGLRDVWFSNRPPYWVARGFRAAERPAGQGTPE